MSPRPVPRNLRAHLKQDPQFPAVVLKNDEAVVESLQAHVALANGEVVGERRHIRTDQLLYLDEIGKEFPVVRFFEFLKEERIHRHIAVGDVFRQGQGIASDEAHRATLTGIACRWLYDNIAPILLSKRFAAP